MPNRQIPSFPPLRKGDEKGDFFAAFASPDPSFQRKPESRGRPGQALRETFRASIAALPRRILRGEHLRFNRVKLFLSKRKIFLFYITLQFQLIT